MSRFGRVPPSAGRDVIDRKACFLCLLAQAILSCQLSVVSYQIGRLASCPSWLRRQSGCLNSAFSQHFSTFYEPSVQAMDTQLKALRTANTSHPRSDLFWLLELRVSRTLLDK